MKIILAILITLLLTFPAFPQAGKETDIIDEILTVFAKDEIALKDTRFNEWTDEEAVARLSKRGFKDKDIKRLYRRFKNAIVDPPDPTTYKEYKIKNAKRRLINEEKLGREMHNMFLALSDSEYEKYGKVLSIMGAVVYLDIIHIPLAIKGDSSRDSYWYDLHTKWVKAADCEYSKVIKP